MRKTAYPNNLLYALLGAYNPETHHMEDGLSKVQREVNAEYINQILQSGLYPIEAVLTAMIRTLNDRLRTVLINRYQRHHTLQMCAEQLNLSIERIRQNQQMALQKLHEMGLVKCLITMIWPIDPRDYAAMQVGYEPRLSLEWKTVIQSMVPKCDNETNSMYADRLYASILQPVFRKLKIETSTDLATNL